MDRNSRFDVSQGFGTAVLGCCGLGAADGLTAHDLAGAAVERAAVASSRRVVAVMEGAKLSRTAPAHVVPVSAPHAVVTDESAPPEEVAALEAAGVLVRTAPTGAWVPHAADAGPGRSGRSGRLCPFPGGTAEETGVESGAVPPL